MAKFTVAELEIERPTDLFQIEMSDGKTYTMPHPRALSLKNILELNSLSVLDQVRVIMGADWDAFAENPEADGFLFDALMAKYYAHYGLGSPGESSAS